MKFSFWVGLIISLTFMSNLIPEDFKTERELMSLYRSLWSPFCPGRSLADCPSGDAENLKKEIKILFLEGKPKQEIVQEINRKYNDEILAYPERWPHHLLSSAPLLLFGLIFLVLAFAILKKLVKSTSSR